MSQPSIVFSSTGPVLSAEEVGECERRLGVVFPMAYRRFLLRSNGGVPDRPYFRYVLPGDPARPFWTWVERFYSAAPRAFGETDFTLEWAASLNVGMKPIGFVEVASSPAQVGLLLDCRPTSTGGVWLKDYAACETEEDRQGHCHLVAAGFSEFIAGLAATPSPEPSFPPSQIVSERTNAVAAASSPPSQCSFRNSGRPVTSEVLANVERNLGVSFPPDYARFLLTFNGGQPVREVLPIATSGGGPMRHIRVLSFFRVRVNHGADATLEEVASPTSGLIPPEAVLIGKCPGRKVLGLYCSGPRCGQVWLKDPAECQRWDDPLEAWTFVSDNFTSVLARLE